MVGWLLGCLEGAALGQIVGALVGLAEGKLSGHDCVYDGDETVLSNSLCRALDDQGVVLTDCSD